MIPKGFASFVEIKSFSLKRESDFFSCIRELLNDKGNRHKKAFTATLFSLFFLHQFFIHGDFFSVLSTLTTLNWPFYAMNIHFISHVIRIILKSKTLQEKKKIVSNFLRDFFSLSRHKSLILYSYWLTFFYHPRG